MSDETKTIALPLEFIPAEPFADFLARLKGLLVEKEIDLILIGLPRNMDGSYGPAAQKAEAFAATIKSAGLNKIDILEITHFHADHVGGAAALSKLVPIGKFYDHGDSIEASTPQGAQLYDSYQT